MNRISLKVVVDILVVILLSTIFIGMASGDGGVISPYHIYEYAQNAVVAWNDGKEFLVLEVGIYTHFEENQSEIKALRVIPFPSFPKIVRANESLFEKIVDLVREKDSKWRLMNFWGGPAISSGKLGFGEGGPNWSDIIYYGTVKVGPHTIGLFKIGNPGDMEEKVEKVFEDMGVNYDWVPDADGKDILNDYIENGYSYFAFDVITVERDTSYTYYQKVEPVGFIFNTTKIYYPVEITFLSKDNYDENTIALYVITPLGVDTKSLKLGDFEWKGRYKVSNSELQELDKNIASFVSHGYLDLFLGRDITRGSEPWNFEAENNSMDPYIRDMIPFLIVYAIIAFLAIFTIFPRRDIKEIDKKRRKVMEVSLFTIIMLFIMGILYLIYLHYLQIFNFAGYSAPERSQIQEYYFTELYIIILVSLILLFLAFKIKNKISVGSTWLGVFFGLLIILSYMEYITLPAQIFGIMVGVFMVLLIPYEMRKGFNTSGFNFQKKLALIIGIPLFIFAFIPGFQIMDMAFYALFMGFTYLMGEVTFEV